MEDFKKEELLEKVKELCDSENYSAAYSEAKRYAKFFRSSDEDSFYDQELADKFNGYLNDLADKAGDLKTNTLEKKNEIIAKAKELLNTNSFKKATEQMKELFDEWKHAGHLDKEADDALWEEFNGVRNEFFAKKKEYFENLIKSFEENKNAKLELIEKTKAALESDDIPGTTKLMNELMEAWKKVGNAGRDSENDLWKEFSGLRKEFYKKRDSYYEAMKATYAKRVEEKEELIAQAKVLLARSEFSKEEIEEMDSLRAKWKEIGSAGRDHENDLWTKFSGVINKYNENKKYYK